MSAPLRGVAALERGSADVAPAAVTGVRLGVELPIVPGGDGAVSVRLFRPSRTRIVVAAPSVLPQLLALRAVAAGAAVRIRTMRPGPWSSVLRSAVDVVVAPPGPEPPPQGSMYAPVLVVDDRPAENSPPGEAGAWQCRVDIRTPPGTSDVGQYAGCDLLVVGRVSEAVARALGTVFELPGAQVATLLSLPDDALALIRSGGLRLVHVEPDPSEWGVISALPVGRDLRRAAPPRAMQAQLPAGLPPAPPVHPRLPVHPPAAPSQPSRPTQPTPTPQPLPQPTPTPQPLPRSLPPRPAPSGLPPRPAPPTLPPPPPRPVVEPRATGDDEPTGGRHAR